MTDDVSVHADPLIGNVMRRAKRSSRRTVNGTAQEIECHTIVGPKLNSIVFEIIYKRMHSFSQSSECVGESKLME